MGDAFETANTSTNQDEIVCQNCTAKLKFLPGTTSLKCEFCGTENTIEIRKEAIHENDYLSFLDEKSLSGEMQEVQIVKCNACAAEVTMEENIVSQDCPFCGNHLVVKDGSKCSVIKPKSLLPFKIDKKEARDKFRTWINKLWFAPGDLKKNSVQNEPINGMYIPFWTYDTQTTSDYRGERGDDYQETNTFTNSKGETEKRTVTKTRWTSVAGTVRNFFNDILIAATRSLPEKYMRKLEPWDLENLIPFDEKFLSGFRTESYSVDLKAGFEDAKKIMEEVIRGMVRKDIGGDKQKIHTLSTDYQGITFKHVLLPLWISAYRYNNKTYRFLINARTGEVQGERPYSALKIILAILGVVAVAALVYFLVTYFGQDAQSVTQ